MNNSTPMSSLTDAEIKAVDLAADLWNQLCKVVGRGPTRDADLGELAIHIHAIQQAVMSNAAARAYPNRYRLLGELIPFTRCSVCLSLPGEAHRDSCTSETALLDGAK